MRVPGLVGCLHLRLLDSKPAAENQGRTRFYTEKPAGAHAGVVLA